MWRYLDFPDFRSKRGMCLRFVSTDVASFFLDDLKCPLAVDNVSRIRTTVRELASPLDYESLAKLADGLEASLPPAEGNRFNCWATFVCDPVVAPYMIWITYEYQFLFWAMSMRRGVDNFALPQGSATVLLEQYDMFMSRRVPNPAWTPLMQRIAELQAHPLSPWDRLVADLLSPSDGVAWNPFAIIETSFRMLQFQRFIRAMNVDSEVKGCIERCVYRALHPENLGPFLTIDELPLCCV